jgi:hypothetical protein
MTYIILFRAGLLIVLSVYLICEVIASINEELHREHIAIICIIVAACFSFLYGLFLFGFGLADKRFDEMLEGFIYLSASATIIVIQSMIFHNRKLDDSKKE